MYVELAWSGLCHYVCALMLCLLIGRLSTNECVLRPYSLFEIFSSSEVAWNRHQSIRSFSWIDARTNQKIINNNRSFVRSYANKSFAIVLHFINRYNWYTHVNADNRWYNLNKHMMLNFNSIDSYLTNIASTTAKTTAWQIRGHILIHTFQAVIIHVWMDLRTNVTYFYRYTSVARRPNIVKANRIE